MQNPMKRIRENMNELKIEVNKKLKKKVSEMKEE